jgi:hypothetical protein
MERVDERHGRLSSEVAARESGGEFNLTIEASFTLAELHDAQVYGGRMTAILLHLPKRFGAK